MKTGIRMAVAMLAAVSSGAMAAPFSVSSNDMRDGQPLAQQHWFAGFGCTGGNVSPQLTWKNAPAGTRSFAVTVRDPDAPTGSGWWHWTVVNIASSVFSLPAGAGDKNSATLPGGAVQGRNDFGYARLRRRLSARREINRTAIALRYGRWMSPRCRWMPGPAGRWSAICYTAMLSPAHS